MIAVHGTHTRLFYLVREKTLFTWDARVNLTAQNPVHQTVSTVAEFSRMQTVTDVLAWCISTCLMAEKWLYRDIPQ